MHLAGLDGVHCQPGGRAAVRPAAHRLDAGHGLGRDLHARHPLAFAPEPLVAHQHDVGALRGFGPGQQPGDQLRADAGGIAQGQGDDGFLLRAHVWVIPRKCCSS
ncbi:hypothetical protein D9M70_600000 [compost metagenome]